MREKNPQHERKNSPTCEEDVIKIGEHICLVVIWVILYLHEKHLQNTTRWPFIYDGNVGKKVGYNQHVFRWLWVWSENMPFLHQEGPFLASRRACSRTLKGLSLNVEGRELWGRETKNVYTFGACGKRGQSEATDWKDWDSWQDSVTKLTGKTGTDNKIPWRRWQDGAEQLAGKADADGKKSGRGRSERWGKNGEDNRERAGGGGRKKLMSMKIIG